MSTMNVNHYYRVNGLEILCPAGVTKVAMVVVDCL